MAETPDQRVARVIGKNLDSAMARLIDERRLLTAGPSRILEIDAEIVILQAEKARIDPRLPPLSAAPTIPDTTPRA